MSNFSQSKFELISHKDLELLFNWRNDDHHRGMMMNSEVISWDEHVNWFSNYSANPLKESFIYSIDDEPTGVLNVDLNEERSSCEWGFYLHPDKMNKGYGKALCNDAVDFIFSNYPVNTLKGRVLEHNKTSQMIHEKIGFSHVSTILENNKRIPIFLYELDKSSWLNQRSQ